jgi:tRNA (guanine-N7-)-methyltransferase
MSNVRIFCADAMDVLERCIPDNSLTAVQLFFPDPWPKRRHHKRRLVQPAFVELVCRKLQNQGYLHMATDWQDYANHMLTIVSAAKNLVNTAGEKQFTSRPTRRPLTKFEQRGQKLGHQIWDLAFQKIIS